MDHVILFYKKHSSIKFRIFLRKLRWTFLYYLQSLIQFKLNKKYYCPVDERRYRVFVKTYKRLLSRTSGARERHRFIWHYIQSNTDLFEKKGISLLHISPEYCFYEKFKKIRDIQYLPVDKFEPGYDYMPLTKDFDLLNENLEPEKYDFIICNHVLEHIIDDKTAIDNLFLLLKKDGTAIISVPILENNAPTYEDYSITSPKERKKYFGQWDHVRYYGTDIRKRFEDAGFRVKTIDSEKYFTESGKEMYGITHQLYLFELSKP